MRMLIAFDHYPVCLGRYITDAFQHLGHDVRHIGTQRSLVNTGWGVATDAKYDYPPDGSLDTYWQDWTPDLVIMADSALVGWMSAYSNTPHIVWGVDNHVRNYRIRADGIVCKYDHYFLAHYHGAAQPVIQPDETWLPCAFDSSVFQPSQIAWNDRFYDVCLIGVAYERRVKLVSMLNATGLKVFAATGLIYNEFQQSYANSRISLCVSANNDLAQRVFETAAIGCHVLTDRVLDLADDTTNRKLGLSGFSVYLNDEMCIARAKALVTVDAAQAEVAAKALQAIVWRNHKWEDRCRVILQWVNQHK